MNHLLCSILLMGLLLGCSNRDIESDAARFASDINERTKSISTVGGLYTATSRVEVINGNHYLRTTISGSSRDEIGLAVKQFYEAASQLSKDAKIKCDANGAFSQGTMSWNGREIQCVLLTVRF